MTWGSACNRLKLLFCFVPALLLSSLLSAQNPIVTENALPGNPFAEWGVPNFRDNRITGFATKMSLNAGETVRFKVNVQNGATYTMKIYRLGYYNGNGARLKHNFGTLQGAAQPAGLSDPVTGILDCSNWSVSASWNIPSNAVSGLYIAKMERTGGGSNHIVFIVRNDNSHSDLYLQFPDATWQAYNGYGGNSAYDGTTSYPGGHAVKVSYNRPFFIYNSAFNTDGRGADWYMNNEYPMIRFLERNGYDVTYTSSNDVANNGQRLLNHKVFIAIGHDEYWSKEQRNNVEAARNAGVHLAFFTGNEVYWKTRWETSVDGEHRTLVCYKEGVLGDGTQGERSCGGKCDGSTSEWTGLWRTGGNYDAGKPENSLVGQISWVEYPTEIGVPAFYKKLRFWRNTSIASLSDGQTVFLGNQTLGYEWDYEQYEGSYPPGRITMSSRTINSLTHKLSLYRHSSGALVFGAGTVQWSWGLDGNHWGGNASVSPEMQQATINLFADMNVQPATLMPGMVSVTASTDAIAPTATITSPANDATFPSGATLNFTGTAVDAGGGVVAGVEISVDAGNTWRQATLNKIDGTVTWSFTWPSTGNGTFNIRFRSFDDSGNIETAGPGINVNVGGPDNIPPTVTSVTPANGSTAISIGTTVIAEFSETINPSTITSSNFQLKAGSTTINTSINITPNQVTLVPLTVLTPSTNYTVTIKGGPTGVKDVAGNPLATDYSWSFTTGAGGGEGSITIFKPTDTPEDPNNNDGTPITLGVRFRSTQNGFITGLRYYKGSGATGTHTGHLWTNSGTQLAQLTFFNETASGWQEAYFNSPIPITAGVTYVAAYYSPTGDYAATDPYFMQAVVNGPLRGLADGEDGPNGLYQYAPTAVFPTNSFQSSNYWIDVVFTTNAGSDVTPPTVSSVNPQSGATGVNISTTVVANFSEAINPSTVTGTTFQLRGPGNTLVTATVSASASQIILTPSAALAGSTNYTATITGGASGVKDMAGNALASDFVWSFTTVAVDVTAPTVTSVTPTNGATAVSTDTAVVANFSEAINPSTVTDSTFQLRGPGNTLVTATVSASASQIILTPSAALAGSTNYTATITGGASGVKDMAGNALASDYVWSFTTVASDVIPPTVTSVTPINGAAAVSTGTTVVANFSETVNPSTVTGTTFQLRGPGNTLVTATVIASANQITLTPSTALAGSTTYTATITGGGSGVKDMAGNALASDFVWTFTTVASDVIPPTVTSVTPTNGAAAVSTGTTVAANFSEAINPSTVTGSTFQLRGPGNILVTATISANANQIALTPSAALAGSTTYTATITGGASGVKDMAGNALASDYVWSFTTVASDVIPPTVTSVTPTNGATAVSTDTAVVANFSEAINPSTVTGSSFQLRGPGNILVTATISANANQITLTPSAALAGSTNYTATITGGASGVKDLAGNALASDFVWTFTTVAVDVTAPTVTSVTPTNGANGVGTGTTVAANFSEAINPSTVTGTTFQLRGPGNTLVTATISANANQITLTPSAALAGSTTYTATITGGASGVKDLAGNALASNFVWTFTTVAVDATAPTVTTVTPASGANGVSTGTTVVANFSEAVNPSTVTGTTFQLRGPGNTLVSATVSAAAGQITLIPSNALAASTLYTATITGGASGVKDLAGNALASNFVWSFTTAAGGGGGCPCTLFLPSNTPNDIANDGSGISLGMKFRSTQNGFVTGLRYYKGAGSRGARVGSLWSSTGTLLAQVNFSNETASGWQQAALNSPVAIAAGVTYIVSYFSPSGDYVATDPYFTQAVVNGPLRGLANGEDGPNGLYLYTSTSAFPTNTYNASNYWVDVVFTPTAGGDEIPPTVTSVTPQSGATGVSTGTTVIANFSEAVDTSTVTSTTFQLRGPGNTLVTASVSTASNQITLTPLAPLAGSTTYTATITGGTSGVKDNAGNALASNFVWSFTTASTDITPPTMVSVTPLSGATGINTSTSVVANFNEAINPSTVTGTTFRLRGPGNTLVTATVSTSASQITLTPSAVLAGSTTYTATITGGGSGVKDLSGNALASNYVWSFTTAVVDVTPPTVNSVTPTSGATGVSTGTTVVANFSETINAASVTGTTFQLRGPGNTLVAATVSAASNQITLVPSTALASSTLYTVTITGGASGVKDLAGNALASNFVWSFTTGAGGGSTALHILPQGILPSSPRSNDGVGIALGVRFRSSQNGVITGVRYFKGAGTTGTHIGQLWTNTGVLLAQATFTNETASGWQTALFNTPVSITAGVNYVASYHSPSGDFAATVNYYNQAVVNGPLRGLANGESGPNGLYRYSATPVFPNNGYQSSNYWADVVFVPEDTGTASQKTTIQNQPLLTRQLPVSPAETFRSNSLDVNVMPNPTRELFNIIIKGNAGEPISVRVFDIFGQLLERHDKLFPGQLTRMGQKWRNGTYIVEVTQGNERKVVKIIKAD